MAAGTCACMKQWAGASSGEGHPARHLHADMLLNATALPWPPAASGDRGAGGLIPGALFSAGTCVVCGAAGPE